MRCLAISPRGNDDICEKFHQNALPQWDHFGCGLFVSAPCWDGALSMKYLWLDGMTTAVWAKAAYLKWGFEVIGEDRLPKRLKSGHEGMFVLAKDL